MKLQGFKKYLFAPLLLGFCGSGWAAPYPIPGTLPGGITVGADIDGNGLFIPGLSLLTFELFDLGEVVSIVPEFEFGYYFASDAVDGSL